MDAAEDTLTLDIEGWEGPLDLLLALARSQKVDLKQISILQLVEQYLSYIEHGGAVREAVATGPRSPWRNAVPTRRPAHHRRPERVT